MFKRRTPRSTIAAALRFLWPRGGWLRAGRYLLYRLRRLPDPAHKISRGIACGVFVCFTPLFGLHFFVAAGLAWLVGGNIVAALLSTFVGNPVTFPFIAGSAMKLGSWMLGQTDPLPLRQLFDAFGSVWAEMWDNAAALVGPEEIEWDGMGQFLSTVFLPYLVGGTILGIGAGVLAYVVSRPVISAYQTARISRMKQRFAKRRESVRQSKSDAKEGRA